MSGANGALDVVVVGGGHNGLVCAGLLARRGLKVLVLERRPRVGGAAVTEEFHPGFRVPTLAHAVFPLRPRIARELGLAPLASPPEPRVYAPLPDGRALVLFGDVDRSAAAVRAFSAADALRYTAFQESLTRVARLMSRLLDQTPPDLDSPDGRDAFGLLKLGVGFRLLGRGAAQDLLRWAPMPAADFVCEWFESEPLRTVLAARGVHGSFAGPRSPGTAAHIFFQAGADGGAAAGGSLQPKGGPGALSEALAAAARRLGAEIRTGADVARILVKQGRATGVALATGEELAARAVVSGADPKTTFLRLLEPAQLDPEDRAAIAHYRQQGMASKLHLALDGLPAFRGNPDPKLLGGRIHISPSLDSLERAFDDAKYGGLSREPYLDVTIPSLADPSFAPAGRHVMSIYVQYTPRTLRDGTWSSRRDEVAELALRTLEAYAPGIAARVLARQVVTPEDIEREYGIEGGHPLHGEPGLDQLFVARPLLGFARYRAPIASLYLCGAGTHPGGGVTGAPGANAAREIARDLKA